MKTNYVTDEDVFKMSESLKEVTNIEEYFVHRYYMCHRFYIDIPINPEVEAYIRKIDAYINYDTACFITYPNLEKDSKREVFDKYNIFRLMKIPYYFIKRRIIKPGTYDLNTIVEEYKNFYKEVTDSVHNEELPLESILEYCKRCVDKLDNGYSHKLTYNLNDNTCEYTVTDTYKYRAQEDYVEYDRATLKSKKRFLQQKPKVYLDKKLLTFAKQEGTINDWEFNFYMSILKLPEPRTLSKKQRFLYEKINSKIINSL